MRSKVTILFLLLTALSCGEKSPIPHKKMVDLFTDIMLLEGGNQAEYNFGALPQHIWQRDYQFVCKKHQLDTNDFKATMVYLEKKPEAFSKILEEVITRLQKTEVQKNLPKP